MKPSHGPAFSAVSRTKTPRLRCLLAAVVLCGACVVRAAPVLFDLPAQPADRALLACSQQAQIEVLFSPEELARRKSVAVQGRHEPEEALRQLLAGSGYTVQRNGGGKFVVLPAKAKTGALRGRFLAPDGAPARGVQVSLPEAKLSVHTDRNGEFLLKAVPTGSHRLIAGGAGFQAEQWFDIVVTADAETPFAQRTLRTVGDPVRLAPYIVEDKSQWAQPFDRSGTVPPPRTAAGNIDLHRTADDVLPFSIYSRDQIQQSGVVNLNEFLQRELLDSNAGTPPPEQDNTQPLFVSGSTNLGLRGYETDETVVLVNGRRMPEIVTAGLPSPPPDVNLIPLSLVQQVQVLPVSASALYSGNAVGGVINIILRPDVESNNTEVRSTYTNALRGFDAAQSSVSVLHGRTLLGGALRLRFNLAHTQATPVTESELHYRQSRNLPEPELDIAVFRATPNIRSADGSPLFGRGSSSVTSVAPGAVGTGGIAAFAGRQGVRSLGLFKTPSGLTNSFNSLNNPYGRSQQRQSFYGSLAYDATPWLQIAIDTTLSQTRANRGYDVLAADLEISADSPANPFGQDIRVSLNEIAPLLGENTSEARQDYGAAVIGLLFKLPGGWRASWDTQYARSITHFRGIVGADSDRWVKLIDQGLYLPFRDTQVHNPPEAFYDKVLVYRGHRGEWVTLGDYDAVDFAFRATQETFPLPTGHGTVNIGGDYRRNRLKSFNDERRFGDGSLASELVEWDGRTLQRYSAFGELQASLLPERSRPSWLRRVDGDFAVRYVAADTSRESNIAPTCGLKLDFACGLALRGSFTTSSRYPTPHMSRRVLSPDSLGTSVDYDEIIDPRRQERYGVQSSEALDPILQPEEALTQTAGLVFRRGKIHRMRVALDYVDTRKTNELIFMYPQMVLNLESLFPERIQRETTTSGLPGRVTSVVTGVTNMAWRRSQSWSASGDYAWTQCFGGTLSGHARLVFFQRYDRQAAPNSSVVDELRHPDGTAPGLLKYRSNFGVGWANARWGLGWEGQYFHSRTLPELEWLSQGRRQINPYWQFAVYAQCDLARLLPGRDPRYGLNLQARVNNILNAAFPRYANDPSGAGVQPYGDWRGRVYSLSLTATF